MRNAIWIRKHKDICPACGASKDTNLWEIVRDEEVLVVDTWDNLQTMREEMIADASHE